MPRLCIIPARGGSKRIPKKNIRLFLGRPIISYVIDIALDSGVFDEVMVSTDSEEISAIAQRAGAKVPFLRDAQTAGDFAGTNEVMSEVISRYKELGADWDLACCLYATAVLTTPARIVEGLRLLEANPDASYTLPLIQYPSPIQRALMIEDDRVRMVQPEHYRTRSQDLPKAYKDSGQWHWFKPEAVQAGIPVLSPAAVPLVISELEAQDIDNEEDWLMAELKYQLRSRK